ncbi:MAG TPA: amidophosphoribosyltransferase [candidate division WOR-3 bacterium]|uniref:Amidophosphoribosyltransferase n=1 Tax=candidate division WOR-3 bacterium TaxID=2052148 RepID=A0A9C9ELT7_UNCW3|nr:amidophosphoribosyltransferase [candidate division WOR-3 bacterium]
MCGIVGLIGKEEVIDKIYPALIALQHRGQDSAGAVTFDQGFHLKKGNGLVVNVFNPKNLERLKGTVGIGHVRYPTVGSGTAEDAQPFIITAPYGIALAHNGNLVNYFDLKKELIENELRYLNSNCDAEVILNLFSVELIKMNLRRLDPDKIFRALTRIYKKLIGSFAVVAIIAGKGFLACRDKNGIKPLVFGRSEDSYCFASESVALDLLGYKHITDVKPGEAFFINNKGTVYRRQIAKSTKRSRASCIFEYVYFARPDSVIDGIGVYEARLRLGAELGKECRKRKIKPDVVIPVPDTARASAQMVAEILGVKYREGLIKNRYIYRTFIMPTQSERIEAVRLKLNPIKSEIQNKKVLLVDDSIVRGNTAREIIGLMRSVGVRKVYYASYSPPLRFPCVYGIDMQTRGEFIARDKSLKEIEKSINADALIYQSVKGLIRGVGVERKGFCTACFTGSYPTEIPSLLLERIEADRMMSKLTTFH